LKRKAEARTVEAKEKYGDKIKPDNFEEKEKEWMRFQEREQNQKRKDRSKKIGVMLLAGIGTSRTTDAMTEGIHGSIPGSPNSHSFLYKLFQKGENKVLDIVKGPRASLSHDELLKPKGVDILKPPKISGKADELFRKDAYATNPELAEKLNLEKPPVDLYDLSTKPHSDLIFGNNIPKISEAVNVAEVKLSSRGFIQTFDDMKDKLKAEYQDAGKMPVGVKHFVETPSTKLAQEYGFWDTKHGTSAMGLKGEHLAVDAEGHLKLEHLAGKPMEVIDTGANKFDTLHSDKMHVFKAPVPHEVVVPKATEHVASDTAVETHPQSNEIVPENPAEQINTLESATPHIGRVFDANGTEIIRGANPVSHIENVVAPKAPFEHIVRGEFGEPVVPGAKVAETLHSTLDFTHHSASGMDLHIKVTEAIAGQKYISVGDTAIANELHLPDGSTRMQLFENLQQGKQSAVFREAFVTAQEKMNLPLPKGASASHHLFFENRQGGVIDVVHGLPKDPNAVQVLLNGKEIAKGLATVKGPKLTLDPTLHHSWILPETAYDRAFNFLKKTIKLKDNSYILNDLTLPKVVNK
jgi:hypothetical protein